MNRPHRLAKMEIGVGHHAMGAIHGDLYSPSSPSLELAILWICSKRNSWQSLAMMQRFCNGGGEYLKRRWMRQVARKNMVILKKLSGGGIGDSQFSKDYLGDDGAGDSRGFGDQIKKSRHRQATSYEQTLGMGKQGQGYCDIGPKRRTCRHTAYFFRWANVTR